MKCKIIMLTVAAMFLLIGSSHAKDFNVNDRLNQMKTDLNLTDDQVKAVKPILENYKSKIEQAENDKKKDLSNVLSAGQINKMMDIKKKRKKMYTD